MRWWEFHILKIDLKVICVTCLITCLQLNLICHVPLISVLILLYCCTFFKQNTFFPFVEFQLQARNLDNTVKTIAFLPEYGSPNIFNKNITICTHKYKIFIIWLKCKLKRNCKWFLFVIIVDNDLERRLNMKIFLSAFF